MTGEASARSRRGGAGRILGRRREVIALMLMIAKGYRILGFRLRTPQGEIDILAQKGAALVVVEVKSRTTVEAALEAVRQDQRERLRRVGRAVAARRTALQGLSIRLDLIAFGPGIWPRHVVDAWHGDASR